jgi:hypothetical protein
LGWRKAHQVLRREGYVVNHKKIQRLWREERPPAAATTKEQETPSPATRRGSCYEPSNPNQPAWNGSSPGEEHRRILAMEVHRSTGADTVVAGLLGVLIDNVQQFESMSGPSTSSSTRPQRFV